MKLKKSLVGAVLVLALSGGGFATMAVASTSAPGDTPLGKIGEAVDGPPPAGVTVTPGESADGTTIGEIGEAVDGPPPAGVTVTPGELAVAAR
jgi:hypothetical protein